ncbi:hypothetical protein SZ66_14030 [Pantoea ananatis]|nr:hypothetical protein [Pantoea ananatis]
MDILASAPGTVRAICLSLRHVSEQVQKGLWRWRQCWQNVARKRGLLAAVGEKDIAGGFFACLSLAGMSDRQAQIILFLVV